MCRRTLLPPWSLLGWFLWAGNLPLWEEDLGPCARHTHWATSSLDLWLGHKHPASPGPGRSLEGAVRRAPLLSSLKPAPLPSCYSSSLSPRPQVCTSVHCIIGRGGDTPWNHVYSISGSLLPGEPASVFLPRTLAAGPCSLQ